MSMALHGNMLESGGQYTDGNVATIAELDRFTRDFAQIDRQKRDEDRSKKLQSD
jgi:hypothetical protein